MGGCLPTHARAVFVMDTEARAQGGEGPTWGCTMIPLLGDTFCVMQPQVSLTWGRTHTRAAPGDDICVYVCRAWEQVPSRVSHGATRAWAELIAASDPLSVHGYREVNPCPVANRWPVASTHRSHLRTCPLLITSTHLGTVKPHLGTWPSRVQPHLGTQRA